MSCHPKWLRQGYVTGNLVHVLYKNFAYVKTSLSEGEIFDTCPVSVMRISAPEDFSFDILENVYVLKLSTFLELRYFPET